MLSNRQRRTSNGDENYDDNNCYDNNDFDSTSSDDFDDQQNYIVARERLQMFQGRVPPRKRKKKVRGFFFIV